MTEGLSKAAIGSMTHATRAADLLTRAAIRARVVKISSAERSGCTYGVEFPSEQWKNAEAVLARQNIRMQRVN